MIFSISLVIFDISEVSFDILLVNFDVSCSGDFWYLMQWWFLISQRWILIHCISMVIFNMAVVNFDNSRYIWLRQLMPLFKDFSLSYFHFILCCLSIIWVTCSLLCPVRLSGTFEHCRIVFSEYTENRYMYILHVYKNYNCPIIFFVFTPTHCRPVNSIITIWPYFLLLYKRHGSRGGGPERGDVNHTLENMHFKMHKSILYFPTFN